MACSATRNAPAVLAVIDQLESDLAAPWSIVAMASTANLSPYYFSRIFADLVGVSPGRFLTALRIQRAKELLRHTDRSIAQVCFDVGYQSLGSFTTRFTQFVGRPPAAYRRAACIGRFGSYRYNNPGCRGEAGADPVGPVHFRAMLYGPDGIEFVHAGMARRLAPNFSLLVCANVVRGGWLEAYGLASGAAYTLFAATQRPQPVGDLLVGSASVQTNADKSNGVPIASIFLRPITAIDPPVYYALNGAQATFERHDQPLEPPPSLCLPHTA